MTPVEMASDEELAERLRAANHVIDTTNGEEHPEVTGPAHATARAVYVEQAKRRQAPEAWAAYRAERAARETLEASARTLVEAARTVWVGLVSVKPEPLEPGAIAALIEAETATRSMLPETEAERVWASSWEGIGEAKAMPGKAADLAEEGGDS